MIKSRDGNVRSFHSLMIPISVSTKYSISSASVPMHMICGIRAHSHSDHWMEAMNTSLRLNLCGKLGTSILLQARLICLRNPRRRKACMRHRHAWISLTQGYWFGRNLVIRPSQHTFSPGPGSHLRQTTRTSDRYQARIC